MYYLITIHELNILVKYLHEAKRDINQIRK